VISTTVQEVADVEVAERAKVRELIQAIIAADGVLKVEERDFLRRVAQRFGLPQDETDDVPTSDVGRATTTLRGLAPDVQSRVMALLVEAAVVDGAVVPAEHAMLLASAAALGIDACALEERIARRLSSNVPAL
jgi:uncharacterized tellurite resistance protein B-like protein